MKKPDDDKTLKRKLRSTQTMLAKERALRKAAEQRCGAPAQPASPEPEAVADLDTILGPAPEAARPTPEPPDAQPEPKPKPKTEENEDGRPIEPWKW